MRAKDSWSWPFPARRLLTSLPIRAMPHSSLASMKYSWRARRLAMRGAVALADFCFDIRTNLMRVELCWESDHCRAVEPAPSVRPLTAGGGAGSHCGGDVEDFTAGGTVFRVPGMRDPRHRKLAELLV